MPEFNPEWGDPQHEQDLYDLRRGIPDRFIITHYDASAFVDELMYAARETGLNFIELDGPPVAFGTNDPARVEDYKRRMEGWCWQVYDSADESFTEAPKVEQ